jgi:hypothetical protein
MTWGQVLNLENTGFFKTQIVTTDEYGTESSFDALIFLNKMRSLRLRRFYVRTIRRWSVGRRIGIWLTSDGKNASFSPVRFSSPLLFATLSCFA